MAVLVRSPDAACGALDEQTVLAHLQTGSFLAFSSVLFFVAYGLRWRGVVASVVVGAGTLLGTAPWWAIAFSIVSAKSR